MQGFALQVVGVLLALGVVFGVVGWVLRRRLKRLAASRAPYSKEEFSRYFQTRGVPQALIDDVWTALVDAVAVDGFEPQPQDNLETDYGLAEEELDEDFILALLQKHGCRIPGPEEAETANPIETVTDLVFFLARMHPPSPPPYRQTAKTVKVPPMLTIGRLNDLPSVRHGFFCRTGGVSEGLFSSLNCGYGSGDRPENVTENRRRALAMIDLEGDRLVTAYQVHSPDVVEVRAPWARDEAPKADAMVTRERGLALGILTADCVPVLFADAEAGVVGACHAGWKGALNGVVAATVAAMVELGATAERIAAGIGPAICQRSYEVGPEFPAPFLEQDPRNADFFCPGRREGHSHFDIKGYVARRLGAAGLKTVQTLPCDTCAEEERFYSYRRACHRKEPDYGRGLSAIYLEP